MEKSIKGLTPPTAGYDGSELCIGIVHARWNQVVVDALLKGVKTRLLAGGVKPENIIIQTVPGSYELPFACKKMITGSRAQANAGAADLMSSSTASLDSSPTSNLPVRQSFDAVIALGVLIKGETMHFEYICDSVSHGLMRVQLDTDVPVVFGVLTALNEDQALERAGIGRGLKKGHNHGEDYGAVAIEMGNKSRHWATGDFQARNDVL